MKKTFLLLISLFILSACSSVKRGKQAINRGNYSEAIDIALDKLQKDKDKKGNQEHILNLEVAFKKLTEAHRKRIAFLEKEGNPANRREIYLLYRELEGVQKRISPLLPLTYARNREANFSFTDYTDALIRSKQRYADFLYEEALAIMEQQDKLAFRMAYDKLSQLQKLSPGYKDTPQLLEEAHNNGSDFVLVELRNQTPFVIPKRLEDELLNFNTYGLDDFWTEYHTEPKAGYDYDFAVHLGFREILISPESLLEREIPLEAEVSDGFFYKKDRKGELVLDSLGNKIRIENFVKVKGVLYKTAQTKSLALQGKVDFMDLKDDRLMNSYPLTTEFVFENVFASFQGDERLLTKEDKLLLQHRFVPFPSNEQMLLDASDDIKGRLGPILKRYRFR